MAELSKAYPPREVEEHWYARWLEAGCFTADPGSAKPAYSIVIPPPNVTGILHLGHVLNNTIQDILARRARQMGKEVLWLPGTDHAGIATQNQVEKDLRKTEGKTRRDLGREKFTERVWAWKEKYGHIIISQLKRLGCSCDWSRERFTMDAGYTADVQRVFVDLFSKGLIYRGLRMVNWCPVSLTALSDEEVIPKPQKGRFYTMRYEVVEEPGRFLEISTTRPETLMGDTAVAVNPTDERHQDLIGKHVWRPFPRAAIPIIGDAAVDKEFGTGALKVTPAHDRVDFEIGQRHNLPVRDVLHPDGRINCPECPELDGMDRFKARVKAAEMLAAMEALVKEEDYQNNVGFSERADVPIEPRLSLQWFLKYPSVQRTAEAVEKDEIHFRPERWKKTFAHWMGNLQDWCISRQLWWGHRIPVWYRKDKAEALQNAETLDISHLASGDLHVSHEPPADPENWVQDEDSMDTWFSSWLWPWATMDEATQAKFYPTTDLVTGPDIIFFWVARMIMAGYEFKGLLPFENVYFTGIIRDRFGRKMSKSLGNSPDPIMLMDHYGADAVRFGIMRLAPEGTDVIFNDSALTKNQQGTKENDSIEKDDRFPQIMLARNFSTKMWNACRFRQMQGGEPNPVLSGAELNDFHIDILARLDRLQASHAEWYAGYDFNRIAQSLYDFFWGGYCDQFLEAVKTDTVPNADPARKAVTVNVMDTVLHRYLQLLHPYMPHLSEELWTQLGFSAGELLMTRPLDTTPLLAGLDAATVSAAAQRAEAVYETAGRIRNLKASCGFASRRDLDFIIKPAGAIPEAIVPVLRTLAGAASITISPDYIKGRNTGATLAPLGEVYLPLEGLIDVDAERARLSKELEKAKSEIIKVDAKLGSESFISRAPAEVVEEHQQRRADWITQCAQLDEMLRNLE
jgi:valyl-tRNA synthetase